MTTPRPHAQWIDWAPAENGVSTVWATTPTPKMISVKVPSTSADSSPISVLRRNEQPSLVPPGLTSSSRCPPSCVRSCRTVLRHSPAGLLALSRGGYVAITGNRFDEVSGPPLPFAIALHARRGDARPAGHRRPARRGTPPRLVRAVPAAAPDQDNHVWRCTAAGRRNKRPTPWS